MATRRGLSGLLATCSGDNETCFRGHCVGNNHKGLRNTCNEAPGQSTGRGALDFMCVCERFFFYVLKPPNSSRFESLGRKFGTRKRQQNSGGGFRSRACNFSEENMCEEEELRNRRCVEFTKRAKGKGGQIQISGMEGG